VRFHFLNGKFLGEENWIKSGYMTQIVPLHSETISAEKYALEANIRATIDGGAAAGGQEDDKEEDHSISANSCNLYLHFEAMVC
jgi:hypothetical protein